MIYDDYFNMQRICFATKMDFNCKDIRKAAGILIPMHLLSTPVTTLFQFYSILFYIHAGKNIYLHEMLADSDLVLPGVKLPPRVSDLKLNSLDFLCLYSMTIMNQ